MPSVEGHHTAQTEMLNRTTPALNIQIRSSLVTQWVEDLASLWWLGGHCNDTVQSLAPGTSSGHGRGQRNPLKSNHKALRKALHFTFVNADAYTMSTQG